MRVLPAEVAMTMNIRPDFRIRERLQIKHLWIPMPQVLFSVDSIVKVHLLFLTLV